MSFDTVVTPMAGAEPSILDNYCFDSDIADSRAAWDWYFTIDPRESLDYQTNGLMASHLELLTDIVSRATPIRNTGKQRLAASAATEAALLSPDSDNAKEFAEIATTCAEEVYKNSLAGSRGATDAVNIINTLILAGFPAAQVVADAWRMDGYLARVLDRHDYYGGTSTGEMRTLQGVLCESGLEILLNSVFPPQQGIAHASLMRQDHNQVLVDGKVYRWDITFETFGLEFADTYLEGGSYFIQLKNKAKDTNRYHPDLHVVGFNELVPLVQMNAKDWLDVSRIAGAGPFIADAVLGGQTANAVEYAASIISKLAQKPPSHPSTPMLDLLNW